MYMRKIKRIILLIIKKWIKILKDFDRAFEDMVNRQFYKHYDKTRITKSTNPNREN